LKTLYGSIGQKGERKMAEKLELKEVEKVFCKGGDNFEVVFVATLRDRGPIPDKEIQFRIAGEEKNVATTNDKGETPATRIGFSSGSNKVLVEAWMIDNERVRYQKELALPRPEQKKSVKLRPHKLVVRAIGKDGKYKLNVFVCADDGTPIKDHLIVIEDSDYSTEEHGTIRPMPEIEFSDDEKKVSVHAGELVEVLPLSGPPRWRKPPKTPDFSEETGRLQGGFMKRALKAICLGLNKATDDIKKEKEAKK